MKRPFKKTHKPSAEQLHILDFSPSINLPEEKFLRRRKLIMEVVDRFRDQQHFMKIPIYIHPRPLFKLPDERVVFGLRVTDNCPMLSCRGFFYDQERTHIHISAMSVFEFNFDMLKISATGMTDAEVKRVREIVAEMDVIRTTLEELYHYWQDVYFPDTKSRGVFLQSPEDYRADPTEIEAKSWSFSDTEDIIRENFSDESAELLIGILADMRKKDMGGQS